MAAPLPSWPNLKLGDSGYNVQALQKLLHAHAYSTPQNGSYDTSTQNAVKLFQSKNGITSNGVAGAETLSKLVAGASVSQGVKNPFAYAVQSLLNKFQSLTIDGEFGSGSVNALAAFQTRMRLSVTGVANSLDWQYLFGYDSYPLSPLIPSTVVYASVCVKNSTLTSTQQKKNAQYIYSFLTAQGCTKQAACAILGNFEEESGINPGIWEFMGDVSRGYGLAQWTAASNKFLKWAVQEGILSNGNALTVNTLAVNDPVKLMDAENRYFIYSCGAGQFTDPNSNPSATDNTGLKFKNFAEFKKSTEEVGKLAIAFHDYYEVSTDSLADLNERADAARAWFNTL